MSTALAAKDANVSVNNAVNQTLSGGKEGASLEYHRQVLKSKMEADKYAFNPFPLFLSTIPDGPATMDANVVPFCYDSSGNNYVSPSDEIMSPCTAKLNALRNKQVGKYVTLLLPPAQYSLFVDLSLRVVKFRIADFIFSHRVKPKSLFAQASSKRLQGNGLFGSKATSPPVASPTKE